MKRLKILILALALTTGCAHIQSPFVWHAPDTVTSPQAKIAFSATQVVQRISEFQNTVITLSDKGVIPVQTAREIVSWTVASVKTIRATPDGWESTVKAGWTSIRDRVTSIPAIASWGPTIDMLLGIFVGAQS